MKQGLKRTQKAGLVHNLGGKDFNIRKDSSRPGKAGHMTSPIWVKPPYKGYYTNTWLFPDWQL
jgi:hypothetical protein